MSFFAKQTLISDITIPWRCCSCKRLIYNKDPRGYPCAGASIPMYIDTDYPQVCSLCYEMHKVIGRADNTYWQNVKTNSFYRPNPDPVVEHC